MKKNGSKAIPHFAQVIQNIKDTEGVEITMNCNSEAFMWIIELVKLHTDYYNHFGDPQMKKKYGFMHDLAKKEEIDRIFN